MEPKKEGRLLLFGGMLVLGTVVEIARCFVLKTFTKFPQPMELSVTDERAMWNPFGNVNGLDFGLMADSAAIGAGIIIVLSLFDGAKEAFPGSTGQAIIGTVFGLILTIVMFPDATLMQIVWLVVAISWGFGMMLGFGLITDAELYGTFGMVLGISLGTFCFYGGMVALAVMAVLVLVNGIELFIGFLMGCSIPGVRKGNC